MSFDVVVLGGGIIGALSAYELSKAGLKVFLVDKYMFGNGASGNSAAMLELQIDAYRGEPFFSLAKASHDLFPSLYKELLDKTGIDFAFSRCSILQVALNTSEADALQKECQRQVSLGLKATWVPKEKVAEICPGLSSNHFGGALFHEDGQVRGTTFLKAALEGARRYGAVVEDQKDNIWLPDALKLGKKVVVAGGAWTDEILSSIGIKFGMKPIRGQLAVLDTPTAPVPFPVYTKSGGYVTPKFDGTTLVGTTIEDVGFHSMPTDAGRTHILKLIRTLMPSMLERPILRMTGGLRPKSPDDLPLIGPLPQHPDIFVAAGHYRNGILLAPITSKITTAWALGQAYPLSIDPFLPSRVYSAA